MQAELISVGTELLLGQTLNTNAKFLAEQLTFLGINVYFQTTVGDNRRRLLQALDIASKRADLIILTGGLGPTEDDLTKETLAKFLRLPLNIVPTELKQIKNLFTDYNLKWTQNNAKQAAFIPDSCILKNEIGSANGMALKSGKQGYLALPGPPREMQQMFLKSARPWLQEVFGERLQGRLYSTILKFIGITESGLEELLADLLRQQKEVTLALYAKTGEVHLRMTTRACNRGDFAEKTAEVLAEIKKRTAAYFFAQDDLRITDVVAQALLEKQLTISTAESCTGGMLAQNLTALPGSSAYYLGSVISYHDSVKAQLLGVPANLLKKHGAVSAEVALAMATRVKKLTKSDLGVGITGIAGPEGGSTAKPIGLVYIALAVPGQNFCSEFHFLGDREVIRQRSVWSANYLILQYLQK